MSRVINLSSVSTSESNYQNYLQEGSYVNSGISWFGKLSVTQASGGYSMTGQSFGIAPATGDTVKYFNGINSSNGSGSFVITQVVSSVVDLNTYNISLTGNTLIGNTLVAPTTLYGYRPALLTSYGRMARITGVLPFVMCDYTNNFSSGSTGTYYMITGTTGSVRLTSRAAATSSGAENNFTVEFSPSTSFLVGDLIYQKETEVTSFATVLAKRNQGIRAL